MKILRVLTLSLTFSIASISAVLAQDGVLNAQRLKDLPPERTLFVQLLDNSDQNLLLKTEIEKELEKNGYALSESAPLVLNFTTQDQIGTWDPGSKKHVFSFEARSGKSGQEDTKKARVNVFDSASGGLLNKGKDSQSPSSTASQYRLEITIESRSAGKTFWRGWSDAELESGDGQTLIIKMIPPLIQAIGQTIRSQTFPIQ